jgi:uncharacterized membrane protein YbhN (UPF0104 family)
MGRDGPPGGRKRWGGLVRLAISVVVLGWLAGRVEWGQLGRVLSAVRFEYCFAALAVYSLAQLVSSYRWLVLSRALGFTDRWPRYVALYYVGMFFNLFLPTAIGGDVVRAWCLAGGPGRRGKALLSVISERLSGLLALLALGCLAGCARPAAVPWWAVGLVWLIAAGAAGGLVALPALGRWSAPARALAEGLCLFRGQRRRWAAAFGLSLIVQAASFVEVWLLARGLGLPVSFLAFAVVVPLVTLLTMLPVSVNGVGVREGSLAVLLGPAGVGPAEALTLGVLWFCMLGVASLFGGVVYLLGRFSPGELKDAYGPVGGDSDQGRTGQPQAAA